MASHESRLSTPPRSEAPAIDISLLATRLRGCAALLHDDLSQHARATGDEVFSGFVDASAIILAAADTLSAAIDNPGEVPQLPDYVREGLETPPSDEPRGPFAAGPPAPPRQVHTNVLGFAGTVPAAPAPAARQPAPPSPKPPLPPVPGRAQRTQIKYNTGFATEIREAEREASLAALKAACVEAAHAVFGAEARSGLPRSARRAADSPRRGGPIDHQKRQERHRKVRNLAMPTGYETRRGPKKGETPPPVTDQPQVTDLPIPSPQPTFDIWGGSAGEEELHLGEAVTTVALAAGVALAAECSVARWRAAPPGSWLELLQRAVRGPDYTQVSDSAAGGPRSAPRRIMVPVAPVLVEPPLPPAPPRRHASMPLRPKRFSGTVPAAPPAVSQEEPGSLCSFDHSHPPDDHRFFPNTLGAEPSSARPESLPLNHSLPATPPPEQHAAAHGDTPQQQQPLPRPVSPAAMTQTPVSPSEMLAPEARSPQAQRPRRRDRGIQTQPQPQARRKRTLERGIQTERVFLRTVTCQTAEAAPGGDVLAAVPLLRVDTIRPGFKRTRGSVSPSRMSARRSTVPMRFQFNGRTVSTQTAGGTADGSRGWFQKEVVPLNVACQTDERRMWQLQSRFDHRRFQQLCHEVIAANGDLLQVDAASRTVADLRSNRAVANMRAVVGRLRLNRIVVALDMIRNVQRVLPRSVVSVAEIQLSKLPGKREEGEAYMAMLHADQHGYHSAYSNRLKIKVLKQLREVESGATAEAVARAQAATDEMVYLGHEVASMLPSGNARRVHASALGGDTLPALRPSPRVVRPPPPSAELWRVQPLLQQIEREKRLQTPLP
eukprot:TRINITY_DN861_c0_g1_i1.p1 TRINITY_DN861_c0_g1~~TRINITY_DN861_c0_g1_i1.p1  ORF type:complete len:854 (+),score=225.27 TRINITY_DN861_c0_g1_i1:66-2564(+)